MLYELTDEVKKNILVIVSQATIKGAEAKAIIDIVEALEKPINPDVETTKKAK